MFPHLSQAPIKEAVIEFAFDPVGELVEDKFGLISDIAGAAYSTIKPVEKVVLDISFGQDDIEVDPSTRTRSLDALRLDDIENGYVLIVSAHKIAVSKLRPYTSFSELEAEILRVLFPLCEIVGVNQIRRIGARYINTIPWGEDKVLLRHPEPPIGPLGFDEQAFSSRRLFIDQSRNMAVKLVVTAPTDVPDEDGPQLVIDSDSSVVDSIDVSDQAKIQASLQSLQSLKNEVFFACVSDHFVRGRV